MWYSLAALSQHLPVGISLLLLVRIELFPHQTCALFLLPRFFLCDFVCLAVPSQCAHCAADDCAAKSAPIIAMAGIRGRGPTGRGRTLVQQPDGPRASGPSGPTGSGPGGESLTEEGNDDSGNTKTASGAAPDQCLPTTYLGKRARPRTPAAQGNPASGLLALGAPGAAARPLGAAMHTIYK